MTTTTAPNARTWLAKEATPLGPVVVRRDGARVGFGALAPGHLMFVVTTTGTVKRVGRIRISASAPISNRPCTTLKRVARLELCMDGAVYRFPNVLRAAFGDGHGRQSA